MELYPGRNARLAFVASPVKQKETRSRREGRRESIQFRFLENWITFCTLEYAQQKTIHTRFYDDKTIDQTGFLDVFEHSATSLCYAKRLNLIINDCFMTNEKQQSVNHGWLIISISLFIALILLITSGFRDRLIADEAWKQLGLTQADGNRNIMYSSLLPIFFAFFAPE